MRKYRNWILSLGIVAAPGLAVAGPFPFGNKSKPAPESAAGQTNNQEVAENIARALRLARLPGSDIDITVSGGVATLSGQVADERSKAMATQFVGSVPGVVRVDNQLQVPGRPQPGSEVRQAEFSTPVRPAGVSDSTSRPDPAAGPGARSSEQPGRRRANRGGPVGGEFERLRNQDSLFQRICDLDGQRGHPRSKNGRRPRPRGTCPA